MTLTTRTRAAGLLLALLTLAAPTWAGNLDAPGAPAAGSGMPSTADIYNRLNSGAAISVPGTFQEPAAGPTAGTGKTLGEIAARLPAPDNTNGAAAGDVANGKTFWGLRTDGTWGLKSGTTATGNNVTGAEGVLTFPIPDAFYTGGKTATAVDSNLQPGNIKSGVSIFGVTGTASQASGTAAAADVLTGKTFSNASATGINGAMANIGAVAITPGTSAQPIPAGYHNGSGSVGGDANLVAGNIKNGVTLFGVTGTLAWVQPNAVPVANAGAVQNVTTGTLVTLDGLASSDADDYALTYKWTLVYKPSGSSAALSHTAFPRPHFTADADGGYVFSLIVNDGKVDSAAANVVVTATAAPDTTAPTTTAAPSVSGTTEFATTLSVTIHENGTGYYLVRHATAPVPTVAEVLAGNSFAMAANVPATRVISGLTFYTPYSIYFIANDALNNVQAAVQSVAVTTLLTPGYVAQGGLTWRPVNSLNTWANANAYCTNTVINGVSGWRMPTQLELSALYAAYQNNSSLLTGQGWVVSSTWSSTQFSTDLHFVVNLNNGNVGEGFNTGNFYVSCVRNSLDP